MLKKMRKITLILLIVLLTIFITNICYATNVNMNLNNPSTSNTNTNNNNYNKNSNIDTNPDSVTNPSTLSSTVSINTSELLYTFVPIKIPFSSKIEEDTNGYVETKPLVNIFLLLTFFISL